MHAHRTPRAVGCSGNGLATGPAPLGVRGDQANAAHSRARVPLAEPHTGTVPASAGRGVGTDAQVFALFPHPRDSPATDGTHAPATPTRLPARQHATLQNLRPTRSGSNSKYNQRHQRVGRRDQGAPATTAGARSASGAQPFPFANRAQGREEPEQKKRTQAKNQNKKDRTRGSVFCLWRSAQRQTADGRRATHGGQTPTTHQKAVGALGNWTHLTGCIITSHTPYQQQKRPEIRSLPSFPPFSAP